MKRRAYHLLTKTSPRVEKFLGQLETEVMACLWQRGEATVRDVADAIAARRPVAYTTVMTVMARLAEKGILRRAGDRRQFVYAPALDREGFLRRVSGRIVDDLVADFGEVAIAQFLDAIGRVAPERLAALQTLAQSSSGAAPSGAAPPPAPPESPVSRHRQRQGEGHAS